MALESVSDVAIKALSASTREKISKEWYNSVTERIPLLNKLKQAGSMLENVDGGRAFFEAAITGDSAACGPYRSTSVLNVNEQEGLDYFQYFPAGFYASVYIDGLTEAMNMGEAAQLRIIAGRLDQAKGSMFNALDKALCGAKGDVINSVASDWIGIKDIIADTNTSTISGTGVDRSLAQNIKTRNQVDTTSIATAAAWNTSAAGRNLMTSLWLASSFDTDVPKLCLMTRSIYAAYDASLQANERFVGMSEKQGGGYPKLVFMNDCEVTYGDNVATGHFYFINPNYLKFKVLTGKNFKMSDFLPAYNQDGKRMLITLAGQLTSGAPKFHGVATGIGF